MKKRYLYIICALSTIVLTGACKKDYLQTSPTDLVTSDMVFATLDNATAALNGVHKYMYTQGNAQDQGGWAGLMIDAEIMADDVLWPNKANGWFTGAGAWNDHRVATSGLTTWSWRFNYRLIGNVNNILDQIDGITGDEAVKQELKAEALTYRAWAYFNLVQYFGKRYDASAKPNNQLGVPLMLKFTDKGKARNTVEEVYTQINKDLDEAIAAFTAAKLKQVNKSHLSLNVAKGIKARVALTMQDYPTALKQASEVWAANPKLMDAATYQSGFNNYDNTEWLWGSHVIDDQTLYFYSFFAYMSWNFNSSNIRPAPKVINSSIYDPIPATDVRKTLWEAKPTAANFPLPASTYVRIAYMNRKFASKSTGSSVGDVPYMRSAEMLLIAAEAAARAGNTAEAQNYINLLTAGRDTKAVKTTKTGQDLLNEILWQRRIELWGEGFRWFDLKRMDMPLDRTKVPNLVALVYNNVLTIPAGDNKWQFVIPQAELDANDAIKTQQNP